MMNMHMKATNDECALKMHAIHSSALNRFIYTNNIALYSFKQKTQSNLQTS